MTILEGNPGVFPLDPDSPVGRFRILYSITAFDEYSPPVEGFVNYRELSDVQIEGYVAQGDGSITRAIGYYLLAQASHHASESKMVKDYDLQVDLRSIADDLRQAAEAWFERADIEEINSGFGDLFEAFGSERQVVPEGTLPQMGRVYQWEYL